jgi:hypothetical protein
MDCYLIRVLLGTSTPKEGAGIAVGKKLPQEKEIEPQEGRKTPEKMMYPNSLKAAHTHTVWPSN